MAYLEETRWRPTATRAWLWGAVTRLVPVLVVRLSRGGQVARALLGPTCAGILVPERDRAYTWYPVRWRPLCGAPVLRDCAALRARGGPSAPRGEAVLAQARQMVTWWPRVRAGTWPYATLRRDMPPLRREVVRLLEAGRSGEVC